jgi:subtilisin family serine protease
MKVRLFAPIANKAGLLCAFVLTVVAAAPATAMEPAVDTYIVVLEDDVANPATVAKGHEYDRGAEVGAIYRSSIKGYSADLSEAAVEAVRRDPRVDYVEPADVGRLTAQVPSTGAHRVSALSNATLDIDGLDDVRVPVDVAVIDTGVDAGHPDLNVVARTACTHNLSEEEAVCIDGVGTDEMGHGTHVAGIVGALDNGIGTAGVASGARIWSVKVHAPPGLVQETHVLAALEWVHTHASEIEVVNVSLAMDGSATAARESVEASTDAGVVFVAGAGNFGPSSNYWPARFEDVVSVSALADFDGQAGGHRGYQTCRDTVSDSHSHYDLDDSLWSNSSFGPVVDMIAPGVCINSTWKGGGYAILSGTSMASPHVAGAAAVLAARQNPNSETAVLGIRQQLASTGNQAWTQDWANPWENFNYDHLDPVKEPLLDVGNEAVFAVPHPGSASGIAATSSAAGEMQLFARNATGQLWRADYSLSTGAPGWQPWNAVSLPVNGATGQAVPIVGSPAVASRHSCCRDVFVRGTDNQLYFRNWNAGSWGPWFWIPGPGNQPIVSSPATVEYSGQDALTVVVKGSDGQIHLKNYNAGSGWSPWLALGTPPGGATSAPAVAIHLHKYLHIVVRGGDGAIWDRAWNADTGTWSGWISLGATSSSAPALTASGSGNELYLVVRGANNVVWYRKATFGWGAWTSLGGQMLGDPAATSRDAHGVDVFVVGLDSKVQHRRYVNGGWTNWMRVDENCPPGACTWTAGG